MAKNILKEAIADAKAVREVALANAKAALEEAFTPKLQSMLSAKLSETLNEEEEELEETVEEIEETVETVDEGENLDEEIDLEEILNELELEESEEVKGKKVEEAKDDDEDTVDEAKDEDLEEIMKPHYEADDVQKTSMATDLYENEDFNLDALLEEINNLDENEDEVNEDEKVDEAKEEEVSEEMKQQYNALVKENAELVSYLKELTRKEITEEATKVDVEELKSELIETKKAFKTVKSELNEVNLLNSKLLYVNRIFKANTLDEGQKLRVVETLDKAETAKEAKLIYETIKDTFNVAKSKKASFKTKTKSLKEGIGMASKAAGLSTGKKAILSESNDMMTRFQKLANIKINQ